MQPSVPTSSSWRRCPCLSIDMARKLAVFGLVFALTELSAAYLPLSALWLAAAIFVAAGIWPSIRRESVRVIAVPLMAAVVLGLGCSTLYRWFVVRPAEALSGRTAEIVATVQTDAQTSYREEMLSATLHITEMDGEPADLYASCGAFPGARAGEIFSARVSLEALEDFLWALIGAITPLSPEALERAANAAADNPLIRQGVLGFDFKEICSCYAHLLAEDAE